MKAKPIVGVVAGGISVAFSSLCVVVTPVFTPAVLLAAFVGFTCAIIALALQARRTAFVASTFALTPLLFFLLIEYDGFGQFYVALLPIGLALAVGVLALVDYFRARRASPRAALRHGQSGPT